MAEFLLMPFGSAGDTFPFIGLGKHLKERGHTVRIVANGYFRQPIRDAGLMYDEFWSREDYLKAINNPDIWHPTRGFKAVVGHPQMPTLVEEQHQLIIEHFNRNPKIVVVAGALAFGARIARETHGLKLVTLHLAPTVFLSVDQPPRLPTMEIPKWWPRSWVRFLYWLANRTVIAPTMQRVVGNYRRELLLPHVPYYFHDWIHSNELVLCLFPEWFAKPARDWPPRTKLLNFPFYDSPSPDPLPAEVEEFLRAGNPPVVMTFGSAMKLGKPLFKAAMEACQTLTRRAIILTPFAEQLPQPLPPYMKRFDFVPLSKLLPRCSVLVHHGGIGTTSQGLRAGIPQLITPLAHDQFDNAHRVEKLGVSRTVPGSRVTGKKLAKALYPLLTDLKVKEQALRIAQRFENVDTFAEVAQELEHLSQRSPSTKYRF